MPHPKYLDRLNTRRAALKEAINRNAPNKEKNVLRANHLYAFRNFKAQTMKKIEEVKLAANKARTS